LSFVYVVLLTLFIVSYVGEWLVNRFYLPGLLATFGIALFFVRRPIKQALSIVVKAALLTRASRCRDDSRSDVTPRAVTTRLISEVNMASKEQSKKNDSTDRNRRRFWSRRRLVPVSIALLFVLVMSMPWRASVGNYGALIATPNREVVIRAPESATLI